MAGAINQYDGTILFERVLKSNLPTKASGKRIFFVVNNPTDTVGEIWATNKDGGLVCYSMAMNLEEVIQLLGNVQQAITDMKNGSKSGSLQQQINILESKFASNQLTLLNGWSAVDDGTMLRYAKSGNAVRVYGLIRGGVATSGTIVCLGLPTPKHSYETKHVDTSLNNRAQLNVFKNGNMTIGGAGYENFTTNTILYVDLDYE